MEEEVEGKPLPDACKTCKYRAKPTVKDAVVRCTHRNPDVRFNPKKHHWFCYSYTKGEPNDPIDVDKLLLKSVRGW
ncbi:MAG: hypothetical protein GWP09_00395 [Nitrospiraceae bacterium]|nr:hypothetical protein [Nitrospiraceae bacterium]